MALTPAIREFLVRLEDLVDAHAWPALGPETVTEGDRAALVRLPHAHDAGKDVEAEVDDHQVTVRYGPEHVVFTKRDEALRFIEMLGDGRVELEVERALWTTMRSYRDGQTIPFRRTRMPWPTLRFRIERRRFGFG